MPEIQIPNPESRKWTGPYLGNYDGILWRTFNIDLEASPGNISISKNPTSVADTSDSDLVHMGVIDAFSRNTASNGNERWWALSRSGRLFLRDTSSDPLLINGSWILDFNDTANSPTDGRDMTVHENDSDSASGENQLFVTRDTDVAVLNDTAAHGWNRNWWVTTKSQPGLISGVPHPIEYFPARRITLVGDGNFVHTIDKNETVSNRRLTLPYYLRVQSIFVTAYRAWILCSGRFGLNGGIVSWDGSSETYERIYDVQSVYPLAGIGYNEVPIVVNNRGLILEFDGNGFSPMERNGQVIAFPIYEDNGNSFGLATSQLSISPRGMTVSDDGLIYINAKESGLNSQRQLGGIYCLNPRTGNLYSKYSLGHGGSDTDYGQQIIDAPGAIKAINIEQTPSGTEYLAVGGRVEMPGVGSNQNRIWVFNRAYGTKVNRGYFITQYFLTASIQEIWEAVWAKFSAFRASNNRIIIKARGANQLIDTNKRPIQKTITWTSGTTFTVTLASGDDALAVGDEVEVVGGLNAGNLAHITVISGNHASLQTITIDETVTVIAGTSYARFDRWKKLGVINDTSKYAVPLNTGITSTFVQFKVELRGTENSFNIQSLIAYFKEQTKSRK